MNEDRRWFARVMFVLYVVVLGFGALLIAVTGLPWKAFAFTSSLVTVAMLCAFVLAEWAVSTLPSTKR